MNKLLFALLAGGFLCVADIRLDIKIGEPLPSAPATTVLPGPEQTIELRTPEVMDFEFVPILPPSEDPGEDPQPAEPDGSTACSA